MEKGEGSAFRHKAQKNTEWYLLLSTNHQIMLSTNAALNEQLQKWSTMLIEAQGLQQGTISRGELIEAFCRVFVPVDVTEDDIQSFSGQLSSDEEFFDSFCREINQCATGDRVEKISGDQVTRAEYTILPGDGAVVPGDIDIVREVAFICNDGRWTAEG